MMENQNKNEDFLNSWICPISQQLMTDPFIADDGFSYQRASIECWFKTSSMSPITGLNLSTTKLIPNRALKQTIEEFLQKKKTKDQLSKEQKELELELELDEDFERLQEAIRTEKKHLAQLPEKITKIEHKPAQTKKLIQETRKKQVKIDIEKHEMYGKYINYELQGKMMLDMSMENLTDQMVQEIVQCDLSRIQILDLGYNKISDHGFNLLFQNRQWPVLQAIYLTANKIRKIHLLHTIANLKRLFICKNQLSEDSCTYICGNQWPKLTFLSISFQKGVNDKCWEKLLTVIPQKFPKLEELQYSKKEDISRENQEKIEKFCKNKSISLYSY